MKKAASRILSSFSNCFWSIGKAVSELKEIYYAANVLRQHAVKTKPDLLRLKAPTADNERKRQVEVRRPANPAVAGFFGSLKLEPRQAGSLQGVAFL